MFIGATKCAVTAGGLVAGTVTAASTGAPLGGATVVAQANLRGVGISVAAPGDPALPPGFYWLFAGPGGQQFTATDGGYAPNTATVNVTANTVTSQAWALKAGHITITGGSISATQTLGQSTTVDVTFSNDGAAPAQVSLTPASPGFTQAGTRQAAKVRGAPLQQIRLNLPSHFTLAALNKAMRVAGRHSRTPGAGAASAPAGSLWKYIADYPIAISGNAVAYDPHSGNVYSVGGDTYTHGIANGYAYNPSHPGAWAAIASLPQPRAGAAAAFVGGKLYVIGGGTVGYGLPERSWGSPTASVDVYDPVSNSWSQAAPLPHPLGDLPSAAVLGDQLYVIGGCPGFGAVPCGQNDASSISPISYSRAVYRYDPAANTWTQLADFPVPTDYASCAGIDGEIVCAGGITGPAHNLRLSTATYIYDPVSNTWSRRASMPYLNALTGVVGGANGRLQIIGGLTVRNGNGYVTNQGQEYDPVSSTWSALPNANFPEWLGGGSCGLYQVGGYSPPFLFGQEMALADTLPGYGQCGPVSVPWLTARQDKVYRRSWPVGHRAGARWTRPRWPSPAPTPPG